MKILVVAKNLDDKIGPTAQIVKVLLTSKTFSNNNFFFFSEKKEKKLTRFIKRMIGKIYHFLFRKPSIMWNHKIIAKKIWRITKRESIDLVFAVAGSFNYFQALKYLKKKGKPIKYVLYYADIFSTLESNILYIKMEEQWINNSILCIENYSHKYLTTNKFGYKSNIIFVEWPSIFSIERSIIKTSISKVVKIAYIGSFYYPHRGVKEMLDFINIVVSLIDCKFYLIGTNVLDFENKENLNTNVVLMDRMEPDTLGNFLSSMDFLINIENSSPFWLPSKLIQYLQCNKAIINIGSEEYSISKEYLSNYSSCFFNYSNSTPNHEIISFIKKNVGKVIINKNLEHFNKEYIAKIILDELKKRQ